MIYFVCFFVGILNGIFASGAGQVLVFYLIYVIKLETHKARIMSIASLSISSIFTIFGYKEYIGVDIYNLINIIIITGIAGVIGMKIMKKFPSEILNLISGILIVGLTLYRFLVKE